VIAPDQLLIFLPGGKHILASTGKHPDHLPPLSGGFRRFRPDGSFEAVDLIEGKFVKRSTK